MTAPATKQRKYEDRRWCSDRRLHDRRRGWQFDRRSEQLPVAVERRSGSDRRIRSDRRGGADRRTSASHATTTVVRCETELETGEICGGKALLRCSSTGAWRCFEHLAFGVATHH